MVEYCFQCKDFPCGRYQGEEEYDSFITHRNRMRDLEKMREAGAEAYGAEQKERVRILHDFLDHYNDGDVYKRQTLTKFTHNMIFIYSIEGHDLLFSNESAEWFCKMRPKTSRKVLDIILGKSDEELEEFPFWEMAVTEEEEDRGTKYFGVESCSFSWRDQMATVHILMDDTERKKKENLMYKLAYVDPLTGLNNRRYAMDQMKRLMEEGTSFVTL